MFWKVVAIVAIIGLISTYFVIKDTKEIKSVTDDDCISITSKITSEKRELQNQLIKQNTMLIALYLEIDEYNATIMKLEENIEYLSNFADISLHKVNFGVLTDIGETIKSMMKTKENLLNHRDNLVRLKLKAENPNTLAEPVPAK